MSNSLTTVTGKNLVTNGSFEQGSDGWFNAASEYARAPQQGVEVNSAAAYWYGVSGLSGSSAMEIDAAGASDKISQTIQTAAGKSYLFSFDAAMRAGTSAATNAFDVYWTSGGVRTKLGSIVPTSTAMANYSFLVDARYVTGSSTISFEETGGSSNTSDTVGGIVDNVSVREVAPSVAPAFSLSEVAGATGGTALLSAVTEFGIGDQDRADTHIIKSVALATNPGLPAASLAAFQSALTASLSETRSAASSQRAAGQVTLAFSVQNRFVDFLGEGRTLQLTYNVTIQDSRGGAVVQPVTVMLTGSNDAPVIQAGPVSATLVELAGQTGSATPDAVTAALAFTDADLTDTHVATATLKSVAAGGGVPVPQASLDAFAAAFSNNLTVTEPNGATAGRVTANFSVADRNFDFLAAGQTVSLVYEIGVNDGNGGIAKQNVTVAVTGTNDGPTVTSAAGGTVTEDATSTATGTIAFTDADLSDGHTASFVRNAETTTSYGVFSLGSVSEAANAADGTIGYTYALDNSKVQFLGRNDSAQEKFDVTISDGNGGTVTRTVAITIVGTNDAPVLLMDNLVRNGSFEDGAVGYPVATPAWTGSNGYVEIGIPAWYGVSGATGAQVLELDAFAANYAGGGLPDQVSQTIATSAGQAYKFSFDAAMRAGTSPDTNQFDVYWNGTKIATVRPTDTAFKTFTFDVVATGPSSTIAFKEVTGPNNIWNDSYGGLIDNVSVRQPVVNLVKNSSFEEGAVGYPVSTPAWTGSNGYVEIGNPAWYGVASGATGEQVLELDAFAAGYAGGSLPDQVSQTIATSAGQAYRFSFDAAMRAGTSADTNQFEVYWNGTKVATIRPTDTAFKTFTFDVVATGTSSTIAFKEVAGPNNIWNDSYGGLIDNVSVIAKPTTPSSTFTEKAGVAGDAASADAARTSFALTFSDVDVRDTHTGKVAVSAISTTAPGGVPQGTADALPAAFTFATIEPTAAGYGTLNANFSLLDKYLDFLGAGQTLTVTFQVAVDDGAAMSAAVEKTITFTGTNDAPIVTGAVTAAATEDGAKSTLNALANASDVDAGTVLQVQLDDRVLRQLPPGVSYDANAKTFTLDPSNAAYQSLAAGQQATVSVAYRISDGIVTTPASVSWVVTGTNDGPVVTGAVMGTATEDGAKSTLNALANASDVDAGTVLQVQLDDRVLRQLPPGVSYDANAKTFTLDPTNAAYQSLAAGQQATVSVAYRVSDGLVATPASVSWVVTGTNDAPVVTGAVTGTATEDGAKSTLNALANASDVDAGTVLQVQLDDRVLRQLPPGVSYDANAKTFTLDPSNAAYQSLAAGQQATVSVAYRVSDGIVTTPASASWTVTGTNDDAVISVAPARPDIVVSNNGGSNGAQVALSNGDGTFAAGQAVNTGSDNHNGVAIADVNGDGRPDLIVTNYSGVNGVQVSLGNGDGTFQTGTSVATGNDTHTAVVVADVNRDGRLDLVVANAYDGNGAQVSLGNGDGTFQAGQSVNTGGMKHFDVAVADVNGDGKLDLIVSNFEGGNGAQVSLGNGDGTFQTGQAVNTGGDRHYDVAVADVNGDGKPDLIAMNFYGSGLQVSLGNGDGTFQTGQAVDTGGDQHYGFAAADVNGDGKLDLIVTNSRANSGTQVSLGNGDGTFQIGKTVNTGGFNMYVVAVADVNGDGKPDLVVSGSSTQVSLGNGDGTFQDGYSVNAGGDVHFINSLVVADVNLPSDRGFITEGAAASVSDKLVFSDVDLKDVHRASATYTGTVPALGVLTASVTQDTTNTGTGGEITWVYTPEPAKIDALAQGQKVVETYDVALNDGTSTVHKAVTITLTGTNDAPVLTGATAALPSGTEDTPYAVSAAALLQGFSDPDGDALSVTTVTADNGTVTFANGTYTITPFKDYNGPVTLRYGVTDGTATTAATQSFTLAPVNDAPTAANLNAGLTLTIAEDAAPTALFTQALTVADVDSDQITATLTLDSRAAGILVGDGSADFFTTSGGDKTGRVYTITGTPTQVNDKLALVAFDPADNFNTGAGAPINVSVAITDRGGKATQGIEPSGNVAITVTQGNHDAVISVAPAKPDIIVLNNGSNSGAQVSLGNGDGTFQNGQAINTGGTYPSDVAVADLNGDGKPDVIVSSLVSNQASVQASFGNGDGTFQAGQAINIGGSAHTTIAVADLNGDGTPDLIAANYYGARGAQISLGNGNGTFAAGQSVNTGGDQHRDVAVADVNGDGKLDLIVPNLSGGAGAQVSLGGYGGTFRTGTAVNTGGDGHDAVAVADVNRDGKLDLIVSNISGANGAQVSLGNGDGTFQTGQAVNTGGGSHFRLVVADVNGDGTPDIIVANGYGAAGAQVSLGNGDGTFQTGKAVNTGGDMHYNVAVADVNGDGRPDIIVSNMTGVQVSLGNGDGTFQTGQAVNTGSYDGRSFNSLVVADVNLPSDRGFITEGAAASVSDKLVFSDVDLKDVHRASATYTGTVPALGVLTASVTQDTTNTGTGGEITWVYTPEPAKIDALAQGQKVVETYDVALNDGTSTVHKAVTITLTGTNDAPVFANDPAAAASLSERPGSTGSTAKDSANGTLAFRDVDLSDTHTLAQSAPTFVLSGGTLTTDQIAALTAAGSLALTPTDSTGSGSGSIGYVYSVTDGALDFLAAGQTLTANYGVTVDDRHGGTAQQTVSIAMTGANDSPVISVADRNNPGDRGSLTEDATSFISDKLVFTDADLADGHTVTTRYTGSGSALGTLTASVTNDTTGTGTGGEITWVYTPDPTKIDALRDGERKIETFEVALNDGTSSAIRSVTITLTGTNDAPVVSNPVNGIMTRNGGPVTLSALANASDADRGTVLSVVLASRLPDGVTYDAATKTFTLDPTDPEFETLFDHGPGSGFAIPYGVSDGITTTQTFATWTVGTDADAGSPATLSGSFSQMNASLDAFRSFGNSIGNAGAALVSEVRGGAAAVQSAASDLISTGAAGGASALADVYAKLSPLIAGLVNQINSGAGGVFSKITDLNAAVLATLDDLSTLQRSAVLDKTSDALDRVTANLQRITTSFPSFAPAIGNMSASLGILKSQISQVQNYGTVDAAELADFNADLLNLNAGLDKVKGSGIFSGVNLVALGSQINDLNNAFAGLAAAGFDKLIAETTFNRDKLAATTDLDTLNAVFDDIRKAGTLNGADIDATKAALVKIANGIGGLNGDKTVDTSVVIDTNTKMAAAIGTLIEANGALTPADLANVATDLIKLSTAFDNQTVNGTSGNDVLFGGAGNDVINGLGGDDLLFGGAGSNTFVFAPGAGQDKIGDFTVQGTAHDVLDLRAYNFASLAQVIANTFDTSGMGDARITLNSTDSITLTGVAKSDLAAHPEDFRLA